MVGRSNSLMLVLLLLVFMISSSNCNSSSESSNGSSASPLHQPKRYIHSRASYYSTSDGLGTASGACGYGEFGRKIYDGDATDVAWLFRGGAGCGACYQVKCSDKALCSAEGVTVVATDYGEGDRTDFIMSRHGFSQLSSDDEAAQHLFAMGVVDIIYTRVACEYSGYNIMMRIDNSSSNPYYLAFTFVYVGGGKDIIDVEVYDEKEAEHSRGKWRIMRRSYGAVWDMSMPPTGALRFRLTLRQHASSFSSSAKTKLVYLPKHIPSDWLPGQYYDTGIQL